MNESWIKLFRKFREWGWYGDSKTKDLFIELLLTANYEDKEWNGITIKRGQTVVGRKQLAEILGFTEQNIRTSITRLKSTNEITSKSYNHFTVVTIKNYDKYQQLTNIVTNNQPASNQQVTTPKEIKKERNKEYINTATKKTKKLYEDKWTLEEVGQLIVKAFNLYLGTNFKEAKSFLGGLEYWLDSYTPQDIETAISKIKFDKFWKDKMTPVILFRRKNPQGEPVDYISQLLNYSNKENYVRR